MQFHSNTLIRHLEVIPAMELIADSQFDCVYLDIPWFTGRDGFTYRTPGSDNKRFSRLEIKRELAKEKDCTTREITNEQVKEVLTKRIALQEKAEIDEYGIYISRILENAKRVLKDTGMLVFRAPAMPSIDYKLMLDQVFSNTYVKQIMIENMRTPLNHRVETMNHEVLYFYSKSKKYTMNQVYESIDAIKDQFPYEDEKDRYRLYPLIRPGAMGRFTDTWKEVTPPDGSGWLYNTDKLDELFADNRIVIKNDKAFLKRYMKENRTPKSSVWKTQQRRFFTLPEKSGYTLRGQHMIDVVSMVTNENDWIFSPYDVDRKLAVVAEKMHRNWVVIQPPVNSANIDKRLPSQESIDYEENLTEHAYDVVDYLTSDNEQMVYQKILKDVDDINDLKSRLNHLHTSVTEIKQQLGVQGESEEVIIEQIQFKIDEMIEKADIDAYIPIVQSWINPHWEKLEQESKLFLPTAELLFKEFQDANQFDLTTAMIQYSKSLENELFTKMFKGYVRKLVDDKTHIKNTFPQDFIDQETKRFTERISMFVTRYKNNESKWFFELGTMIYVLKLVLGENSRYLQEGRILSDFKNYLEQIFTEGFFDIDFLIKLDIVVKLRNESSHPYIVTAERIQEGKAITKQKIIDLLTHYEEK